MCSSDLIIRSINCFGYHEKYELEQFHVRHILANLANLIKHGKKGENVKRGSLD